MTLELTVKGQFRFRYREMGCRYSVGRRNSKGTEPGHGVISLEIPCGSQFDQSRAERGRKPGSVCPFHAGNSPGGFTSVGL